jgi:hypothetical protein
MFGRAALPDTRRSRPPPSDVDSLMAATRREVAILHADIFGAGPCLGGVEPGIGSRIRGRSGRRLIRDVIEDSGQLLMIIDPRPGLHIIDVNLPYAAATLIDRSRVVGEKLFDVFPDNPALPTADGVGNVFESLRRATQTGQPDTIPLLRYDVQAAADRFVEKHWRTTHFPIFDERGDLIFLVHHVVEVTARQVPIR